MRVLFLIQTFKNLPQIRRLVHTLKASLPQAAIVISHNPERFTIAPTSFSHLENVYVVHAKKVNRVDFSLVRAYIAAIQNVIAQGVDFDWVVNITGQCYPTRPLGELEHVLATTAYHGFMEHFAVFTPSPHNLWNQEEAHNRYHYQYHWRIMTEELPPLVRKAVSIPRRIINRVQPFVRIDTSYALQMGTRLPKDAIPADFTIHGGQYHKILSRCAVDYLIDFTTRYPALTRRFELMNMPEEVFPQSVLLNNPAFRFDTNFGFFIRWEGTKLGRPHILTTADYDSIVASDCFFARKFEPERDAQILDLLDARVLANAAILNA
ncbi:MAG: beta-1,6-N-acetylglucosaminyltransferase [Oscillochloridaceae bacterium umkhey_bin13]